MTCPFVGSPVHFLKASRDVDGQTEHVCIAAIVTRVLLSHPNVVDLVLFPPRGNSIDGDFRIGAADAVPDDQTRTEAGTWHWHHE